MMMSISRKHQSLDYARKVVAGEEVAPKYVIKQCRDFIEIADGKNEKYYIDWKRVKKIDALLKIMIMPKGMKAGIAIYECTEGYQWLLFVATLCVVYRKNGKKRRYQTGILEIARKNFKTFTIAIIFILLFILEPPLSKFYSVAPDGSLSREVREAISDILKMSPMIYSYEGKTRWKILRDYIEFKLNGSKYYPLNYSNSRMDGRLPNVFLADEVGGLPNSYAIEAMRSGQINILNKIGFVISTKYPSIDNPFEDEIKYAKNILDGEVDDDAVFSLLYEPDNPKNWMEDDLVIAHANPVALHNEEIWNDLIKKRERAILVPSARENFLCKHCNIIYQGLGTETYIDVNYVKQCKVGSIDWTGRDVFLGVDLSMTNDNTSVAMISYDYENNKILADVWGFVPEDRIGEKSQQERLDYRELIREGKCFACGDLTIDYKFVEDFVFEIEEKYGVHIVQIGFDRYNCLSSAQKWNEKYDTVEIKQHSSVLHPATKMLYERIMSGEFAYEENRMLEINFQNARCQYDTNMNRYVNKKKSTGKVDMVVSLINAVYLLQQQMLAYGNGFVAQVF